MSDPFIGEIRMVGFEWPTQSWASCDGTVIPIGQFAALYSIMGDRYGGNGRDTFGLPDLRGRAIVGFGQGQGLSNYKLGETAGAAVVTLEESNIPRHTHQVLASSQPGTPVSGTPTTGTALSKSIPDRAYNHGTDKDALMAEDFISPTTGGTDSHDNLQPFLAVNFIIALHGVYPPRP